MPFFSKEPLLTPVTIAPCKHAFGDWAIHRRGRDIDPHARRYCLRCHEPEPDGDYWKRRFELLEEQIIHAEIRERGT